MKRDGRPLWIGVDVGTQSLKLAVVDDAGDVVASAARPLTSTRSGTRHEQDPAMWWTQLCAASRQATAGLATERLQALAVCGTSGTILLVDRDGEAVTAALMYDDARAGAEADEIQRAGEHVWNRLGYRLQPSWALPRLLWLVRQRDLAGAPPRAAWQLAHCTDFLAGRLTGAATATDWMSALKTGYDLLQLRWPEEVMQAVGIDVLLLPKVVRPGTDLGVVSAAAAEATGLRAGMPVRAGMTDGCAAQVAAGALEPGQWNSVLGTTLVVKGVTEELLRDPAGAVYSHRHPDAGWLPGGASSAGAGVISSEFATDELDELDALASRYEPARAIVYPLTGRGERFPFVAPRAERFETGSFADRGERYAALLQGVAFTERLCYDRLAWLGAAVEGPVAITGGATSNSYWTQLRANVLGRSLLRPRQTEPAVGMAVVAAAGAGNLTAAARRMVAISESIDPKPAARERFGPAYERFVDALVERGYLGMSDGSWAKQRWAH